MDWIFANTIWSGAMPFGYRYLGLHVVVELAVEIALIWLLLKRAAPWKWIAVWVVLANLASFGVGVTLFGDYTFHRDNMASNIDAWVKAYVLNWIIEFAVLALFLKEADGFAALRTSFWANTASYSIAWTIFVLDMTGSYFFWLYY